MSTEVEVSRLAATMGDYDFAYLLTVSDDQRTHAVAVSPGASGDHLTFALGLGRRTRANLAARPDVTLLWPPRDAGGYSLIADGRVSVVDDVATFVPEHAVLHRPAEGVHDCVPVGDEA